MATIEEGLMKSQRNVIRYEYVVILILLLITSCEGWKVSVTTLHSTAGYAFEIHTESFVELAAPIYCRVKKEGTIVFPFLTLGHTVYDPHSLEFMLVDHGDLVAIVEESTPHVVLAIYDFQDHISWPCADITMTRHEELAIGKKLLKRLQEKVPDVPFILSVEFEDDAKVR